MSWIRKTVFAYLAVICLVFFVGYVLAGMREMGLYLFLIFVNLPGSLAVVPAMESLSEGLGWDLGHPAHVLTTQLLCMAVNGAFLAAVLVVASGLWRRSRGGRSAG